MAFPHFRFYKKSKHPALIEDYANIKKHHDGYLYRKTSHSTKMTHKGYEVISPNPNPKDTAPMYVENKKRADYKKNFGKILPWKYPKK